MKTVRLSREEFRDRFGDVDAFTDRSKGEEPTVYLPGRASTKEILHEIYHATRSPQLEEIEAGKKWLTPDEVAHEELRAQIFAAEGIGCEDLSWNSVMSIARIMLNERYKPAAIMGSITRALEKEGYEPLDREYKSELWRFLRDEYEVKGKTRGG